MLTSPFVGSEARAAGLLNYHQLRYRFNRLFPDVYVPDAVGDCALEDRIRAAWLWSGRRGVIAGSSAAFLHGARWVARDSTIELIHRNPRTPDAVVARRDTLVDGEVARCGEYTVTTAARTGFDLARRNSMTNAVAAVDALLRATAISTDAIADVASRHRRARGLRQLEQVVALADGGAQSPRESWLRLLLIRAGLPRPQTQIPVFDDDGYAFAYLDMGFAEDMVAVEYDGEHHRTDRDQYVKDIRRRERLERMGWIVITVVAGDRPEHIVGRVRDALARR